MHKRKGSDQVIDDRNFNQRGGIFCSEFRQHIFAVRIYRSHVRSY